jgi:protocatechuate 3,4-dioxygenase beta subunit
MSRIGSVQVEFDRRAFVNCLGAAAGVGLGASGLAGAAEAPNGRAPRTRKEWDAIIRSQFFAGFTCVQATEMTEGPFYYESSLERRAIAEKLPGERLRLGLTLGGLQAPDRCFPLSGAVVDVWHTSAAGLYSNVGLDLQPVDTTGQTFLRGHQITDNKGYVEFDTIVPGWEIVAAADPVKVAKRTTHIHVKVFHEREVLTSQLFFPDPLIDQLYADVEPYKSHRLLSAPGLPHAYARIRNGQDKFYIEAKARPMSVERVNGVLVGKATIGVLSQGDRGLKTLFR